MSTTNTSLFPLPPLYYKKYTDPPISVISTHDKPHEYTLKHQSAYSTQLLPPIPIIGEYSSFGVKYNTATTSAVNQPEFTYQSLKDQLTIITTEFSNVLKFDDVKKIDILNESIKHFHVILNSFRSLQAERNLKGIIHNENVKTVGLMDEISQVIQKVNDLLNQ